jgi:hypothetical protein
MPLPPLPPPALQHRLLVLTEDPDGWETVRAWCPHLGEMQSGPMGPIRWRQVFALTSPEHPWLGRDPLPRRS